MWYVAVGSGGVWKTLNAGVTWSPIFDDQSCYSIGCLAIDPGNPHNVWVGTGENVGGRHVGFGDGIYFSGDDGKSWKNMGLKESQHISKIIVHPTNSNIVWVAAQGPLWNKGGERGLYKTTDGGKTWKKTLGNDEWTGATDITIDQQLNGSPAKRPVGETQPPGIYDRLGHAITGTSYSTYGPTPAHSRSLEIAKEAFGEVKKQMDTVLGKMGTLQKALEAAGAPKVEGN